MSEYYINGLVLIAVIAIIALSIVVSPRFRAGWAQRQSEKKLKAAHAGKVRCEEEGCDSTATRWTPNGFFCEWDYEPHTKRYTSEDKFVTWDHALNHSVRRS